MLKNDTLKNGTSRIGLYGSLPPPPPGQKYQWVFQKKASYDIFIVKLNKFYLSGKNLGNQGG